MIYRVVFTDAARHDLNEIADYIADHHGVKQALYVVGEIRKRVETLNVFPLRGTHLPELADLGLGGGMDYRQSVAAPAPIFSAAPWSPACFHM